MRQMIADAIRRIYVLRDTEVLDHLRAKVRENSHPVDLNGPLEIAPELMEVVQRIYRRGDEAFFRERCQGACELPPAVHVFARENGIRVEGESRVGEPSCRWAFYCPEYVNGEFRVRFSTKVWVSKLVPVFYFIHEFEADNRAPNALSLTLKGVKGEMIMLQWHLFQDRLRPWLEEMGYEQIDYHEQKACVHWLEWKGSGDHGPNVTVEDCVFRDVRSLVKFRDSLPIEDRETSRKEKEKAAWSRWMAIIQTSLNQIMPEDGVLVMFNVFFSSICSFFKMHTI